MRRFLAAPDRRLDTCDFQTETGGRAEAQTGKRAVTQEAPRQRTHTHTHTKIKVKLKEKRSGDIVEATQKSRLKTTHESLERKREAAVV